MANTALTQNENTNGLDRSVPQAIQSHPRGCDLARSNTRTGGPNGSGESDARATSHAGRNRGTDVPTGTDRDEGGQRDIAAHAAPATPLIFDIALYEVRVVLIDGEPWFVAKDVAEALDYTWSGSQRIAHVPAEWRGATSVVTPSGDQNMAILSEHGLYFFLNRSDKPRALPFQKKVAGEILPSIRKTGRYVAPAAQPAPREARERLNTNDMGNLTRMVWFCAKNFGFETAAGQGIWKYLRTLLGNPAPNPWYVDQLPDLARELRRIIAICTEARDIRIQAENEILRRVFRRGHIAQLVLAEVQALTHKRVQAVHQEMHTFPSWMEWEMKQLTERAPHPHGIDYGDTAEQSDFFRAAA
jgi:prophage antirepressor-like protein